MPIKNVLYVPYPNIGKNLSIVILGATDRKEIRRLITIIAHNITLVLTILFPPNKLAIAQTTIKKVSKY